MSPEAAMPYRSLKRALCAAVVVATQALAQFGAGAADGPSATAPKPMSLKLSDEATLNLKTTVTYGTIVRAQGRDPELLPGGCEPAHHGELEGGGVG